MAVKNQLANKSNTNQPKKVSFAVYATDAAVKANINRVVGGKDGPRFISAIVSAVQTNPGLQECSNSSIMSAALLGETLKLSPSPQLGQYYMVPFKDKERGPLATFIIGYKGLIQLALRSGQYKKLNVLSIKEGELIRYDPLNEEIEVRLIEDEEEREKAPTVGYYAMFEYINGFRKTMYWSRARMIAHADRYSAAFSRDGGRFGKGGRYNKVSFADYEAGNYPKEDEWIYSSFWYKDFDSMAYKTMLRQLISKWGIMSIDMQTAFEADNTVESGFGNGARNYVASEEYALPDQEQVLRVATEPEPVPEPVQPPIQKQTEPFHNAQPEMPAELPEQPAQGLVW